MGAKDRDGRILVECHYCGRKFPQLYKVTGEDIQRTYPSKRDANEVACADCLDKLRGAARLVPQQTIMQVVRNFAWMIPVVFLGLLSMAVLVSIARVQGVSEISVSSQWIGGAAALSGILMIWGRLKDRYGFTHDLKWSLNSKRVDLAFAVLVAAIFLLVFSVQLGRLAVGLG